MSPLALVRTATVVLVLSVGVSWLVDKRNDEMHERHRMTSASLAKLQHDSESLTNMLTISLLDKDNLASAGYDTIRDELENTLEQVRALTADLMLADEIASLQRGSQGLRAVEQDTLLLMRAEQWQAARRLLFGESYVMARKIYEIDSDTAVDALNGELARHAEEFYRIRQLVFLLRIAAVLLVFLASLRYSRQLKTQLSVQRRLKRALAESNEALEMRVQERTAQLEELNMRLSRLSTTDGLTGIANRRCLDDAMVTEYLRAQRANTSLAVALLDVDWFKHYNDHYGHQAGDACLQAVASILARTVNRSGDLVARYGGEEFVILAPATDAEGMMELARRVQVALRSVRLPHEVSPLNFVTISIGVAACEPAKDKDMSPEALLQAADLALYKAKQGGRNRVVCAAEMQVPISA